MLLHFVLFTGVHARVGYFICNKILLVFLLLDDFDVVGAYFGHCYCGNALDEDDYAWPQFAAELYEDAFGAVKCSAMKAHFCAFSEVYLFGAQVYEFFVCGLCHGNELLHLPVGYNDWDILAILWRCTVLQVVYAALKFLDCAL